MKKILVGMSGGVDSSVAALLLKLNGYEISGCTLKLFDGNDINENNLTRTCCALSDIEDARSVCFKLNIPHHVFNFKELFHKEVMDRFANGYINGETPNPCIECNKYIKFDKMLLRARELGFDGIATGHYAKTFYDKKTNRYNLLRPADRKKDQTYVLYNMTQDQLAHTLFPLWDRDKEANRNLADEYGLINSRKPDSQDICFVPDGDYVSFIRKHTSKSFSEGDFLDTDGNIIGKHQGIINYTIGQRKGLGIAFGKPMFVCEKDIINNTITLGDSNSLMTSVCTADNVNLISIPKIDGKMRITAKTRYNMADTPAILEQVGDSLIRVHFDTPQRAVTKGQALVIYDGDIVVGGGKII